MRNLFKVLVTIYQWGQLTIKCLNLHMSISETFLIPMKHTLDFPSSFLHFHLVSQLCPATRNIHVDTINSFMLACLKNQSLINNKRFLQIKKFSFWRCIWEHGDKVFRMETILFFFSWTITVWNNWNSFHLLHSSQKIRLFRVTEKIYY